MTTMSSTSAAVYPRLDDIEVINTELALADLDTVEKKIQRAEKMARSGDKKSKEEVDFYLRVRALLEQVKKLTGVAENEDERALDAGTAPAVR